MVFLIPYHSINNKVGRRARARRAAGAGALRTRSRHAVYIRIVVIVRVVFEAAKHAWSELDPLPLVGRINSLGAAAAAVHGVVATTAAAIVPSQSEM